MASGWSDQFPKDVTNHVFFTRTYAVIYDTLIPYPVLASLQDM